MNWKLMSSPYRWPMAFSIFSALLRHTLCKNQFPYTIWMFFVLSYPWSRIMQCRFRSINFHLESFYARIIRKYEFLELDRRTRTKPLYRKGDIRWVMLFCGKMYAMSVKMVIFVDFWWFFRQFPAIFGFLSQTLFFLSSPPPPSHFPKTLPQIRTRAGRNRNIEWSSRVYLLVCCANDHFMWLRNWDLCNNH